MLRMAAWCKLPETNQDSVSITMPLQSTEHRWVSRRNAYHTMQE